MVYYEDLYLADWHNDRVIRITHSQSVFVKDARVGCVPREYLVKNLEDKGSVKEYVPIDRTQYESFGITWGFGCQPWQTCVYKFKNLEESPCLEKRIVSDEDIRKCIIRYPCPPFTPFPLDCHYGKDLEKKLIKYIKDNNDTPMSYANILHFYVHEFAVKKKHPMFRIKYSRLTLENRLSKLKEMLQKEKARQKDVLLRQLHRRRRSKIGVSHRRENELKEKIRIVEMMIEEL